MENFIGTKIKFYRKRLGLSQLELEIKIGASFGSICRIESGKVNPSKETVFKISTALKLNWIEKAILLGIEVPEEFLGKVSEIYEKHILTHNETYDKLHACGR